MKRITRLSMILLALLLLGSNSRAEQVLMVTGQRVNLRTGPGTTYAIMGTVVQGEQYPVVTEFGDWYKIRLEDGREGWIYKTLTKAGEIGTRGERGGPEESILRSTLYRRTWAVIIGIDEYPNLGPAYQLRYAVRDAQGVEQLLRQDFQFDRIFTLFNAQATRDNIMKVLRGELSQTDHEDAVFVFYAGHAITEETAYGPLGYLVPYDGSFRPEEMYKNLSMTTLKEDISKAVRAKHILYVIDACYSGLLLAKRGVERQQETQFRQLEYLQSITREDVRQVLAAGGQGEEVLDGGRFGHSVFTGRFIELLQEAQSYITGKELGLTLPQRVFSDARDRGHKQTPQFGHLFGEGDFVFIKKPLASSAKVVQPEQPVSEEQKSRIVQPQKPPPAETQTSPLDTGEQKAKLIPPETGILETSPPKLPKSQIRLELYADTTVELVLDGISRGKATTSFFYPHSEPLVLEQLEAGQYEAQLKSANKSFFTQTLTLDKDTTILVQKETVKVLDGQSIVGNWYGTYLASGGQHSVFLECVQKGDLIEGAITIQAGLNTYRAPIQSLQREGNHIQIRANEWLLTVELVSGKLQGTLNTHHLEMRRVLE